MCKVYHNPHLKKELIWVRLVGKVQNHVSVNRLYSPEYRFILLILKEIDNLRAFKYIFMLVYSNMLGNRR